MERETMRTIASDCAAAILRAKNSADAQPGTRGAEFWFPVHAWLAEKLRLLPFGDSVAKTLPPLPDNAATLFKLRLDNLMLKSAADAATAEEKELFRLYVACLDLGYGESAAPRAEEKRQEYLRRCRELLAGGTKTGTGGEKHFVPRLPARAAACLLAPAAVAGLYCLYRVWLGRLLMEVVG